MASEATLAMFNYEQKTKIKNKVATTAPLSDKIFCWCTWKEIGARIRLLQKVETLTETLGYIYQ